MGPRDHGLGAVAPAHLAIGRQGMAVVVEYPGAWQEAGRTVRQSAALPRSGPASGPELLEGGSCRESHVWVQSWAECLEPGPPFGPPQPTLGPQCPRDSPMGPRLGPAAELCGGGWPTSWLTEGSLLTPPCTLFMGERTGP